jgi:hypothetical protein
VRTDDSSTHRALVDARDAVTQLGRLLQRVAELSKQVIPGVVDASVTLIANDKATTAAFTGQLALELDESQIGNGYGPCLDAAVGQEVHVIVDAREETRWPRYTPVCVRLGALSSLSVPVPVRENMHAALNLYGREAHAFDAAAEATGRSSPPTSPSPCGTCTCTRPPASGR